MTGIDDKCLPAREYLHIRIGSYYWLAVYVVYYWLAVAVGVPPGDAGDGAGSTYYQLLAVTLITVRGRFGQSELRASLQNRHF